MPDPSLSSLPVDLVVRGRIVTMDANRRIVASGAVAVSDGKIVAAGPAADIERLYRGATVAGDGRSVIVPGFSDCHTHSTQSLVRGLIAGELPMIYRLYIPADMALSPEDAYWGARLCGVQLALSGVTTVCDFAGDTTPEHEDAIIEGMQSAGLRCVFLRGASDQAFHHAALYTQISERSSRTVIEGAAERDLRRTEELLQRADADPAGLFHAGVCPSNLLSYSDHYFAQAAGLARRFDTTLQIHAARDREEVEFCLAVFGRRPIERLADLGLIDDRLVCVHAILATPGEIALLGRAEAKVAHSAVEIVNILNGIPHVGQMRAWGVTVGLGCDNSVNDMFAVMHTAWALQVAHHGVAGYQPDVLTEDDVMAMATVDAARLLRLDHRIGSIEAGKDADLVVLDGNGAHMMPLQAVPTDLVRFAGRSNVRDVFVRGRPVVRDGAPVGVDLHELQRSVDAIGARLSGIVQPRRYKGLRGCC